GEPERAGARCGRAPERDERRTGGRGACRRRAGRPRGAAVSAEQAAVAGRGQASAAPSASADVPTSRILDLGPERPRIEVLEAGEGAPLLFLHGAAGIPFWEGALPFLAREYHVYAPLLPGFGQSTGVDFLEDQLDLFLHGFDVLDALGVERPYVVGESMGGWMAAEMAALRPKEIGRLALAAPIGLWRDEAPLPDLFGHMAHELVPL